MTPNNILGKAPMGTSGRPNHNWEAGGKLDPELKAHYLQPGRPRERDGMR